MTSEEAKLHALELLRQAQSGDYDAANVLVDLLAEMEETALAQELTFALRGAVRRPRSAVIDLIRPTDSRYQRNIARVLTAVSDALVLPSERNTPAIEVRIRRAARGTFGRRAVRPFFEHGQWWLQDLRSGAQYSVIDLEDAEGHRFGFEQVSSGEDD